MCFWTVSVFNHFVGLMLQRLRKHSWKCEGPIFNLTLHSTRLRNPTSSGGSQVCRVAFMKKNTKSWTSVKRGYLKLKMDKSWTWGSQVADKKSRKYWLLYNWIIKLNPYSSNVTFLYPLKKGLYKVNCERLRTIK